MDYEKKYKEALNWMRDLYPSLHGMVKEDAEHYFPELKESEDERMIQYFKDLAPFDKADELYEKYGFSHKDAIAWLEKQGKNNMGISEATKKKLEDNLNKALEKETPESLNEFLDEQGEQKPAYKVEPKFKVKYAGCEYNVLEVKDIVGVTYYGIEDEPNHIDYVKADNCEIISGGYGIKENGSPYPTKPAVFSEQKPAWSEEDEKMYNAILRDVRNGEPLDKLQYDWLKSLKDRVQPQPKQEWTMQDEEELQIALDTLVKAGQHSSAKWLKNVCLVPQSQWKPSEESFNNTSCTHLSKKEAESKVWKQ